MKHNRSSIFALIAIAFSVGNETQGYKLERDFRLNRKGKGKGGRGGFHPPCHARARAWRKAFGGLAVPRIDNTQFMFA